MFSKQKFGESLPLTLLSIPLVLYFSQFLFGTFDVGFIFVIVFSLSSIPIFLLWNRKNIRVFVNDFFSVGFVAFFINYSFFSVMDYKRYFVKWDEFSHWGMMVKEMLRLDSFYYVEQSRLLVHKDYPPFMSLYEMFVCKVFGGYSEPRVYLGLHIMVTSLIVPMIIEYSNVNFIKDSGNKIYGMLKRIGVIVCVLIAYILMIVSLDGNGVWFNTIYTDLVLAVMFSYALFKIFSKKVYEKWDILHLLVTLSAILLTKQMGILFVLLIWLYFSLTWCMRNWKIYKKSKYKLICSYLQNIFLIIIFPLFCKNMWERKIADLGIGGQFALDDIEIDKIFAILKETPDTAVQRQTLQSYCQALFEKKITATIIPLTYFTAFLLVGIILYCLFKMKKLHFYKQDIIVLGITFSCGTAGYAFTMLILYLFCFSEAEMLGLASYGRYMVSYVLGEIIILGLLLLHVAMDKIIEHFDYLIIGIVLTCICIYPSNLQAFVPGILRDRPYESDRFIAEKLEMLTEDSSTVFILCSDTIRTQYYVNYYAEDIKIDLCYTDILNLDLGNNEKLEMVENILFSNQYVYICNINDGFNEAFGWKNNNEDFQEGNLYRINEDKMVTLINK